MESKQTNPIQNLFTDIKKIIEFIEVKDNNKASLYETEEIHDEAEIWIAGVTESDTYLTYKKYWNISMFQEISPNVKLNNVMTWMDHPYNIPLNLRDNLLIKGRELFLQQYVERNEYYRTLNGLPPFGTSQSEFIYLSEPLRNQLHTDDNIPVHELSSLIQNRYMGTEEYKKRMEEYPDKEYLRYLGIYKINPFVARTAKDFQLIRFLPLDRSDINPNLLNEFGTLYNEYREYVMRVLYNRELEGIYENYRTFMGMLIISFVLLQISNKSVEAVTNKRFLDDNVLHILLSMYNIPETLLMTKEVRRNLAINLLKLTREKATNTVYYDLVKILGYQDIIIQKLMLVRGQQFGTDGQAIFNDDTSLNDFNDISKTVTVDNQSNELIKSMKVDPYFIGIDLKDPNPYNTIINGKASVHSYQSIIESDPTWWDMADTQKILTESSYSIADSKYINIQAIIYQVRYLFESIYFTRLILDNKEYTDNFDISIPEIFGTDMISIYDIMVFIIAATCMNNGTTGRIITPDEEMFATAGFNFDIDIDRFNEFLESTQYVDKSRVMSFLENLTMKTSSDINRLFNDVLYPMRDWLESKITQTYNRIEFLEYESIYQSLFTYDAGKNNFLEDYKKPMQIIKEKYNLTDQDILAFSHFYPRSYTGSAITIEEFSTSRYNPFLLNNPVTWNINIPYKGTLYFHDILNTSDLRTLKSEDGMYLFLDDFNELDREAIRDAIHAIKGLSDDELNHASFRVDTPILNSDGEIFQINDRLPINIRDGIFKQILIDKIEMDMEGFAIPPSTYLEYLYRKSPKLYHLLTDGNRIEYDKDSWLNDVMTIVLTLETELNMHMKYFEQSVVGEELFFKPLITLIKHFKSTFVNFAKTGLQYVFGDKIDIGGSSNMFKLFDSIKLIIHFVVLSNRDQGSLFGLYDTEHQSKHKLCIKDRSEMIKMNTQGGWDVSKRDTRMGSIRMTDELKFLKNGLDVDPSGEHSSWYTGETGIGRWSQEDDILMKTRDHLVRIQNLPVDTEGWKKFVESHNII